MRLGHPFKLGLLLGSLSMLSACDNQSQVQMPAQAAPAVSVAPVIHQRITEWDEFTGRLSAPQTVALRPRVSGFIESVEFKEGSLVKAGDPLFLIDSRPFEAEVQRLQAELADASSRVTLAKSNYQRANELTNNNSISEELLDNRAAELEQAQARQRSVNAALEIAQLDLSYTKVVAPINGRVSRAEITAGNLVTAGQSLLTSIVSVNQVYAYFDADEQTYLKYLKLAKEGTRPSSREVKNPVYLSLANETDYPHEGYIDFVDNQVDPATGTIRGRAVFDNKDGLFTPGMFARIKVIGSASYDGILIDDKAIGTDLSNKFVLVLDGNNAAQYRAVALGEKLNGLRIIKSGLQSSDSIVVNGLQRVRPGGTVSPEVVEMANQATLEKLQALQQRVDGSLQHLVVAQGKSSDPVVGG